MNFFKLLYSNYWELALANMFTYVLKMACLLCRLGLEGLRQL